MYQMRCLEGEDTNFKTDLERALLQAAVDNTDAMRPTLMQQFVVM